MLEWKYGTLPTSWELSTIGDYSNTITDYVANGSFASLAQNVQYKEEPDVAVLIRLVDYNNNFKGDFVYIDEHAYEFLSKSKLYGGEIIISNVGANVGTVFRCPTLTLKMSLAPNSIMLRTKGIDDFYYYWFKSPVGQHAIASIVTGSAQPKFNKTTFKKIVVPVPPIETQRKIALCLKTIDEKIECNKSINDNLQQQAKSLYEEMFLNNPDADMVSGTLSDIATITMGQSPSGSSYNEESVGEVFYQGRAEFGFRFPTRRLFTTEPKRMAEPGDVLLSVRAPVGDLNVAYEKCCIGRGLGAIHSKTGDSSFMLYTMFALKPQLDVFNGEGTVFGSINRDGLSNLPVNIPSAEEIAKFEATVRPMDNLIRTNYEEICRLQSIRDSLLPKLMSGEIDVSDIQL